MQGGSRYYSHAGSNKVGIHHFVFQCDDLELGAEVPEPNRRGPEALRALG